jgi:hypothetical protein
MILPDKNIQLRNSLLGWGAKMVKLLNKPRTVSYLWDKLRLETNMSFQKYILTLDFLFMLGIVELTTRGVEVAK